MSTCILGCVLGFDGRVSDRADPDGARFYETGPLLWEW